jgi:hypothetical protein
MILRLRRIAAETEVNLNLGQLRISIRVDSGEEANAFHPDRRQGLQ